MPKNILSQKFIRRPDLEWHQCEDGNVELVMEHKGFFAAIATNVFRRPSSSSIKMDELGSFVWLQLGEMDNIMDISKPVHDRFGDKAEPLLPRLAKFFQILKDNKLIKIKNTK